MFAFSEAGDSRSSSARGRRGEAGGEEAPQGPRRGGPGPSCPRRGAGLQIWCQAVPRGPVVLVFGAQEAGSRAVRREEAAGGRGQGLSSPTWGQLGRERAALGLRGLQCSPAVPRSGNVYLEAGRQQNTWPWAPWSLLLYFFKHSTLFAKFISHFTVSFRGP